MLVTIDVGNTQTVMGLFQDDELVDQWRLSTVRERTADEYRLYFAGQSVSLVGTWMQMVAQAWLVLELTGSPTWVGVVVAVQNERSQLQNKNRAMQILASRLAEEARRQQKKEIDAIRGDQVEAGFGRQIRSYVMQPYQMVKDLRTDFEVGNIQGVLDGDLDGFIDSYLQWRREQQERS